MSSNDPFFAPSITPTVKATSTDIMRKSMMNTDLHLGELTQRELKIEHPKEKSLKISLTLD